MPLVALIELNDRSSVVCDIFPLVSLIRTVDTVGDNGDNVQFDVTVMVIRIMDAMGNGVACKLSSPEPHSDRRLLTVKYYRCIVTLMILRKDSNEVIYTGTIRASWTLLVFPVRLSEVIGGALRL